MLWPRGETMGCEMIPTIVARSRRRESRRSARIALDFTDNVQQDSSPARAHRRVRRILRAVMSHLRILPPPQPASNGAAEVDGETKRAESKSDETEALTEEMRESASAYLRSMIRVVPDEKKSP